MVQKNWFQIGIALIMTLIIILLLKEMKVIFHPIYIIVKTIFIPLIVAGLLYYIGVPIQEFLEKRKVPKWASVSTVLLIITLVIGIFISVLIPMITDQVQNLVQKAPAIQKQAEEYVDYALSQRERLPESFENKINDIVGNLDKALTSIGDVMISLVTGTVQTLFLLILVPFFLIYMLKDHRKFIPYVSSPFNGSFKRFIVETLGAIDKTLRSFIQGQMLVSFILGIMLYAGYLIMGLDYALLLALFAVMTNFIPFLGPYLAVAPAILLALLQDPILVVWVVLLMVVAQQIEGNIITPNVMGNTLNIHPLTVITVVLAAGNLGGFVAVMVAIPTYAVIKAIVTKIYEYRYDIKHIMMKETTFYPKSEPDRDEHYETIKKRKSLNK